MNNRSDIWKFFFYFHIFTHQQRHDNHRKVEDENVCGAPHSLVEDDYEGDKKVPDEPNDDHQGEDDRHL